MSAIFNAVVYNPLYNALVALIDVIPGGDVGLAVIALTAIVRLVLFPLAQSSVKTQLRLRAIQPDIERIKKEFKDNSQKQGEAMMALYREHNINPFSGFLLLLIQLPIIFALYFVLVRGGLPLINAELLYSFVPIPEAVNTTFLGLLDVTAKSLPLALITGFSQYFQTRLLVPKDSSDPKKGTFGADFMRGMRLQMLYGMPVVIGIVAYSLPALVGLYWLTSNLFMIGQELFLRRARTNNYSGRVAVSS